MPLSSLMREMSMGLVLTMAPSVKSDVLRYIVSMTGGRVSGSDVSSTPYTYSMRFTPTARRPAMLSGPLTVTSAVAYILKVAVR